MDGRQQDEVHPVEIFADHRFDGASDADLKIGDLVPELVSYPDEAMVRVAVPGDGHHRLLEITGVGFSSAADEVGGELVVELTCERWDYGYPVVRADQPLRE